MKNGLKMLGYDSALFYLFSYWGSMNTLIRQHPHLCQLTDDTLLSLSLLCYAMAASNTGVVQPYMSEPDSFHEGEVKLYKLWSWEPS